MTEKQARQEARDLETVRDAVSDAQSGEHDPPHESTMGIFRTDEDIHDRKTYNAAWREAKD